MDRNKKLERHLDRNHVKDDLVKFVVAETATLEQEEISE